MPIDPSIPLHAVAGIQDAPGPMDLVGKAMELQARRQQIQQGNITLQQHATAMQDQGALDQAMRQSLNPDGSVNRDAIRSSLITGNRGHLWGALEKGFTEIDDKAADVDKKRAEAKKLLEEIDSSHMDIAGRIGSVVQSSGYDPAVFQSQILSGVRRQVIDPDQARQMLQESAQDPSRVKFYTDQLLAGSPKQTELATQAGTLAETTRYHDIEAGQNDRDFGLKSKEFKNTVRHQLVDEKIGQTNAASSALNAKTNAKKADAELADTPRLTPEALDLVAKQFALTGQMPALGMGKAALEMRSRLINRSAEMYAGLDLASQKAAYEANKRSLSTLQTQRDAVGSFEETAIKNLDPFFAAAAKVVDTGVPAFNAPLRKASDKLFGSEEQAVFNAARTIVIPEFAKIIANPTLSGQLSDSARHEVEQVISGDATLKQTMRVANLLKNDSKNRRESLDDTIAAVSGRIAAPPKGTAAPAQAAQSGTIRARDPQGNIHQAPAGTALPAGWVLQ